MRVVCTPSDLAISGAILPERFAFVGDLHVNYVMRAIMERPIG
jgi:hypothetical protein